MMSIAVLSLLLPFLVAQQQNSIWDAEGVIEYIPGTAPIVISVPHGGRRRPADIPDRNSRGCEQADGITCNWSMHCPNTTKCKALLYGDTNTDYIARHTMKLLISLGLRPHMIFNHMDRAKMDPNRGGSKLSEGIQNHPKANATYQAYHSFIRQAVKAVNKRFGRGIVIDIHGQHHKQNWTEIGYRLTKSQINSGNYQLDECSIRNLISRSELSAKEAIIGRNSFGSLLASFGHKVVPSETIKAPGTGGYYRGGYITAQYGSINSQSFDALQVEITQAIMYAPAQVRSAFGRDLGSVIDLFVRQHYL